MDEGLEPVVVSVRNVVEERWVVRTEAAERWHVLRANDDRHRIELHDVHATDKAPEMSAVYWRRPIFGAEALGIQRYTACLFSAE